MNAPAMNCERVDGLLSDYLEETLGAHDRAALEAHAASCPRCSSLMDDLRGITAQAAALPRLHPSRDLWDDIAHRIETPVIAIATPARVTRVRRAWTVAAAAALVIATAGVTYEVTMRTMAPGSPASSGIAAQPAVPATGAPPAGLSAMPVASGTPAVASPVAAAPRVAPPVRLVNAAGSAPGEATYDREISALRLILRQRRAQLDPKTVAVVERSLLIIDSAIAQSRSALAKDPNNPFLDRQLNKALDRKVELLRTAAMLPART